MLSFSSVSTSKTTASLENIKQKIKKICGFASEVINRAVELVLFDRGR